MRVVMTTITLDILDDKAMNLLKDLKAMNVIKLHAATEDNSAAPINSFTKFKGLMTPQSIEEIDKQLSDLRNEWE
jgi:hypothetical protein